MLGEEDILLEYIFLYSKRAIIQALGIRYINLQFL